MDAWMLVVVVVVIVADSPKPRRLLEARLRQHSIHSIALPTLTRHRPFGSTTPTAGASIESNRIESNRIERPDMLRRPEEGSSVVESSCCLQQRLDVFHATR